MGNRGIEPRSTGPQPDTLTTALITRRRREQDLSRAHKRCTICKLTTAWIPQSSALSVVAGTEASLVIRQIHKVGSLATERKRPVQSSGTMDGEAEPIEFRVG